MYTAVVSQDLDIAIDATVNCCHLLMGHVPLINIVWGCQWTLTFN